MFEMGQTAGFASGLSDSLLVWQVPDTLLGLRLSIRYAVEIVSGGSP